MANKITFTITGEGPQRLDAAAAKSQKEITRSQIQKMIEDGQVYVNETRVCNKKEKVNPGDCITITVAEKEEITLIPEEINLDIIYEDEDLLVVNKPRHMLVHPTLEVTSGTLVNGLLDHCKGKLAAPLNEEDYLRPGIVHRIDKDTSGLLVVAKTAEAYSGLIEQFKVHSIKRNYLALVRNNIKEDSLRIDEPIGRDKKNRMKRCVTLENSRRAVTNIKVIERFGDYTLVDAALETGRTHQIRVHMAFINHPVVGDWLYGNGKDEFYLGGQFLHAYKLGFVHPTKNQYMEFKKEIPEELDCILRKLR